MQKESKINKRKIEVKVRPKLSSAGELIAYAQKIRKENNGELVITNIQLDEEVYELELTEGGGFSMGWKESLRRPKNVYGEYLDELRKK